MRVGSTRGADGPEQEPAASEETNEASASRGPERAAAGSGSRLDAVASSGSRAQWAAEVKDRVKEVYDKGAIAVDFPEPPDSELPAAIVQREKEIGDKAGSDAVAYVVGGVGAQKAYVVRVDTDDDRKTSLTLFDANGKKLGSGVDTTGKLAWD
jgi:hypothetical protein